MTRYQTSLALDQVERNETMESDHLLFNIKYSESCETATNKGVLLDKNKDDKTDNDKIFEQNIRMETTKVRFILFFDFLLFFDLIY